LTVKDFQLKLWSFRNSQKRLRNLDFHSLNDLVWDYNLLLSNQIISTNFQKNVLEISQGSSLQTDQISSSKVRITLSSEDLALCHKIIQRKLSFFVLFTLRKCHISLYLSQLAFNHLQFKRLRSKNNSNSN